MVPLVGGDGNTRVVHSAVDLQLVGAAGRDGDEVVSRESNHCSHVRAGWFHLQGKDEGELYDPVASAFRVKLVRDDVLSDFRFRDLR